MIWYTTREDVLLALGSVDNSINARKIDSAIESASRSVENLTKRRFYPEIKTKVFDYPSRSNSWRLWFDSPEELIEATAVESGGVGIQASDYFLEPANYGPPFSRLELNFDTNAAFETQGTTQQQIEVTGTWGYDYQTDDITVLSGSINASVTSLVTTDVSDIGVGSLLKLSDELVRVTDKQWRDSGQNTSALSKLNSDGSISGVTGINAFETILIDSERMLVTDVAGTTITVRRAVDGTTLAAHTLNTDIYVLRTLVVERGILGTTAASHTSGDTVSLIRFPGPIAELALAEALNSFKQRSDGYARVVGTGENQRESTGKGLYQLRQSVKNGYGRIKLGSV